MRNGDTLNEGIWYVRARGMGYEDMRNEGMRWAKKVLAIRTYGAPFVGIHRRLPISVFFT